MFYIRIYPATQETPHFLPSSTATRAVTGIIQRLELAVSTVLFDCIGSSGVFDLSVLVVSPVLRVSIVSRGLSVWIVLGVQSRHLVDRVEDESFRL